VQQHFNGDAYHATRRVKSPESRRGN
jgi:hypothetical protein